MNVGAAGGTTPGRSHVRLGVALALVVGLAGLGFFVGCGSDDEYEDEPLPGGEQDGSTKNDVNVDVSDAGGGGDGCTGYGASCDPFDAAFDGAVSTCPCGLECGGTQCVAPRLCDDAILNWLAPRVDSEGNCARDTAGFVIASALDASTGPFTNEVDAGFPCVSVGNISCGDAGETVPDYRCTYRATKLANGTWYFVLATYTDAGERSGFTNPASLVVSCP